MRNLYRQFILTLPLLILCGCSAAPLAPSVSAGDIKPTPPDRSPPAENPDSRIKYADDLLSDSEALTRGKYRIEKHRKPTIMEGKTYDQDGHQYAVLKYKNRVIADFDRLVYSDGIGIRFGFPPLLGPGGNQLIVEQTENRGWQYWVVDLDQKAKVIYDSGDYGVGGDLSAVDIDGDGREELIQSLLTFWFFDHLANSESPLIEIVFAYDARSRKYVPANYRFRDFILKDLQGDLARVKAAELRSNTESGEHILSLILKVMLTYIYTGREKDAWEFYEAEYTLPDKAEMKAKIKKQLSQDSLYPALSKAVSRPGK